ncbi:MAG: SulP family inorganic anion transporter, partial [Bdellovibrionales bacterium]|nr:SulP family inorganic anion transporter [Oligoflexia bacterium]
MKFTLSRIGNDIRASIVVLLVAIPLCLGIALASGAPLFSGIIAGMVGGIVVGFLSGSPLSVSGPAAGLTVIVAGAILKLGAYESFLLAVFLAGVIQVILGFLKAGVIGDYVPNCVIKGMLAAIGLILILKQMPHLIGYDADPISNESFTDSDDRNTFSGVLYAFNYFNQGAALIGIISLLILKFWESKRIKAVAALNFVPGPLIVVVVAVVLNQVLQNFSAFFLLESKHLVSLPSASSPSEFFGFFSHPDFSMITHLNIWTSALTLAIVASLETLLGVEAVDKLDPYKRVTPTNRELKAQGVGNMVSGLMGGLPLTSVIVRSSANVMAGATSKISTMLHGGFMLLCVILIPFILNLIPLSSLAAILIFTGYKLTKIDLFKQLYQKGLDQFIPFVVTITAILFTDLLIGVLIGVGTGLFFMIRSNFHSAVLVVNHENTYMIRLRKDVSFLNKATVKRTLEEVPESATLIVDVSR